MGYKLFCRSFLKPWNILSTLAWMGLLIYAIYVYGMYKQTSLELGVPAKLGSPSIKAAKLGSPLIKAISLWSIVFDNLPKACTDLVSPYLKRHNIGDIKKPESSDAFGKFEAPMVYLRSQVESAPEVSLEKKRAQQELNNEISQRKHIECAIKEIGKALFAVFGVENYYEDDGQHQWCIVCARFELLQKIGLISFEEHCGRLDTYGYSFGHALINMCNAGFQPHQFAEVASQVCNHTCALGHYDQAS